MSDNLVGKLVKELQKLALPTASEPPPAKLSRSGNFDRWVSRMEDYLRGIDASGHGSAILAQLDDDVYDLARAAGISSSMPGTEILKNLRGILCGTTPSWLERSDFRRRTQEPPEGVLEFHQALRLLGRRAYPTMKAADMEQMLLDQFVHGVSDPEVRKALLRAQPSTLAAALQLAQQEEALQAACSVRPMDLFRVTSVRPSLTVDAGTQTPWRPCSCGSFSPRQGNWHRQPPRRPNGPQNRRPVQSIDVGPQDNGGKYYVVSDSAVSCVGPTICPLVCKR
ncbi:hypothetical protein SprV_0702317400 [Sparganum proliferum]